MYNKLHKINLKKMLASLVSILMLTSNINLSIFAAAGGTGGNDTDQELLYNIYSEDANIVYPSFTDMDYPENNQGREGNPGFTGMDYPEITYVEGENKDNKNETLYDREGDDREGTKCKISTAEELYEFARRVNTGETDLDAELVNDITINEGEIREGREELKSWDPIGKCNNYEGNFNGNNYTIRGLYINEEGKSDVGLFGVIGKRGRVERVTIENSYIRGGNFVGGIAGENKGEVCNCTNKGIVKGNLCIGGNVGNNRDAGKIEGSKNEGRVEGHGAVGGNVGKNGRGGEIKGSENKGEVKGVGERNLWIGGNVGRNEGKIEGSKNEGIVKGNLCIGGNVGLNRDEGKIEGSKNEGRVEGWSGVGGNVGENQGEIKECENKGEVKGVGEENGGIGGNVGINMDEGKIEGSKNEGRVEGWKLVGGNVGLNMNEGKIEGSENKGEVKGVGEGNEWIGGNVGRNDKGEIKGSENKGEVKGDEAVGGNVGKNFGGELINCVNTGKVKRK